MTITPSSTNPLSMSQFYTDSLDKTQSVEELHQSEDKVEKSSCSGKEKSYLFKSFINRHRDKIYTKKSNKTVTSSEPKVIPRFRPNEGFKLGEFKITKDTDREILKEFKFLTQQFAEKIDSDITEIRKNISEKNSLFLTRKNLTKDQKISILSAASDIQKAREKDKDRFSNTLMGVTKPVIDLKHDVIIKRGKDPAIDYHATLIRQTIENQDLKHIILPTREVWRERTKSSEKSYPVFIENMEGNLVEADNAYCLYFEEPGLFDEAVMELVQLFMDVEILDTCLDDTKYYYYEAQVLEDPEMRDKFPYGCRCNFDNINIKEILDEDGIIESVKFVLVDIDMARKPTVDTVVNLINMFPEHKDDIIIPMVKHLKPELLIGFDKNATIKTHRITYECGFKNDVIRDAYKSKSQCIAKIKARAKAKEKAQKTKPTTIDK